MKNFKIVYMDGYDEVRDLETQEVVFSTKLPEHITKYIDRTTMDENVIDNVVNIWNVSGKAEGNLWSDGKLDEYLLDEGKCTQEEREIIIESLYDYANAYMNTNWTVEKKDEIGKIFISEISKLGMDIPSNFEDIVQFIYEDVCEAADEKDWHSGDVIIGFRRWIESNVC